jgi:hypothetical protein
MPTSSGSSSPRRDFQQQCFENLKSGILIWDKDKGNFKSVLVDIVYING